MGITRDRRISIEWPEMTGHQQSRAKEGQEQAVLTGIRLTNQGWSDYVYMARGFNELGVTSGEPELAKSACPSPIPVKQQRTNSRETKAQGVSPTNHNGF